MASDIAKDFQDQVMSSQFNQLLYQSDCLDKNLPITIPSSDTFSRSISKESTDTHVVSPKENQPLSSSSYTLAIDSSQFSSELDRWIGNITPTISAGVQGSRTKPRDDDTSLRRRLSTPDQLGPGTSLEKFRRSRSRVRSTVREHERSLSRRELELKLERERARIRALEEEVRARSRSRRAESGTLASEQRNDRVAVAQQSTIATSSSLDANGLWYILAMFLPLFSVNNCTVWRCTPSTILSGAELFVTQLSRFCRLAREQLRRLAQDHVARDLFATAMDIVLVVYAIGFLVLSLYQASIIG